MNKTIEKICDELDATGLHYTLIIEKDDNNYFYSGFNTYATYLSTIAIMVEYYMNDTVPEHGRLAVSDLKSVIRKTIELNKAVPDDEVERAKLKLEKILKGEPYDEMD